MTEEPENLTIRLLQELRAEMQEMRTDLTQRIDGNTLVFNLVAGVVHDHEQRLTILEKKSS